MKNIILGIAGLLIVVGVAYFVINNTSDIDVAELDLDPVVLEIPQTSEQATTSESMGEIDAPTLRDEKTVIGRSAGGEEIVAYHFGSGERELLLIAGIHGGYSWNTALLGFELIDWLEASPALIPSDVTVTIIPVLNPDGLKKIIGTTERFVASGVRGTETEKVAARFNANTVDLNRNFDCQWQATGSWQDRDVSGGASAFSEPETKALRAYVNANTPETVLAWYSAAGGVYASNCNNGVSNKTQALTNLYATAAGYTAYETYDYYEITGDMVNWFAKENIPAISILLTTHEATELEKNKAGVTAVLTSLTR